MNGGKKIRELFAAGKFVVAPGAHDMLTGKIIASLGFDAVYMTGYGQSASHLGKPDVGLMTMSEMVARAANMVEAAEIPVIADADTGFGNAVNVMRTVREYEKAGVAVIQLEDQVMPKKCGHMVGREVISKEEMLGKIKAAVDTRQGDMMIMARTDARTVLGIEEAIERGIAYKEAGADIVFIESPETQEEMKLINDRVPCLTLANMVEGGTPEQMEKAMVLAMSPTIGVPCTPRVLVPALCTTHVGGAILIGMYAARICMAVDMNVNVPFDVMLSMASLVHVESAKHIVPTVVEYMEPFFQRTAAVESLVSQEVRDAEKKQIAETLEKAGEISKKLAAGAGNILSTFGDAVVGGSSQAVGSPTNCGRIAHELLNEGEKVCKITVELYPELFARRTINIPGVLMGAVYGASTADHEMYEKAVDMVKADGVEVEIVEGHEPSIQKVTLVTDKGNTVQVDSLNRGGGRLVLRNALPSLEQAQEAAKRLGIVVVQ